MASTGVPAAIFPKTGISLPSLFFGLESSKPPLITLGEKLFYMSFAEAVSGSLTTSKALAL